MHFHLFSGSCFPVACFVFTGSLAVIMASHTFLDSFRFIFFKKKWGGVIQRGLF